MKADKKDVLNRLASAEGHLQAIRRMIEEDTYCVDVLKQTYAVQRALSRMQAVILRGHLSSCVPERITTDQKDELIEELAELYDLAQK
jgi:CsoR family transcriptional regulator, copper-sensing transcriptional repressor